MVDGDHLHELAIKVGLLEGTLRTFMETWRDQDTAAALGRRVTHEKMELQAMQIGRLAVDVQNVQQDEAEMKHEIEEKDMPVIDAVEAEQAQRAGARKVWAWIAGAAAMVVSALAYVVDKLAAKFWP